MVRIGYVVRGVGKKPLRLMKQQLFKTYTIIVKIQDAS